MNSTNELEFINHLLSQRYFVEAAYFGTVSALKRPTAWAHMVAGISCCGCVEPLAVAQRLLENAPISNNKVNVNLHISPATELPYEGFFHLVQAIRLEPAIEAPENLCEMFNCVAEDLAYASRRELHRPPDKRKRYTLREANVAAALLIKQLTGSKSELPGVLPLTLEISQKIIDAELTQNFGDARFF